MENKKRYCPSCGENVPVYDFDTERGIEVRCAYCSFPIDWQAPEEVETGKAVIIADDATTTLTMLQDFFTSRATFNHIVAVSHGGQVIKTLTELWHAGREVALAILDIRMPILNGAQTAIAIRWMEKGFGIVKPTPILFLSALRIDDNLKKVIAYCRPASYLNKASDDPETLLKRLNQVVMKIIADTES